jgi:hypothetical protein
MCRINMLDLFTEYEFIKFVLRWLLPTRSTFAKQA